MKKITKGSIVVERILYNFHNKGHWEENTYKQTEKENNTS